jgi:hypothetical protein
MCVLILLAACAPLPVDAAPVTYNYSGLAFTTTFGNDYSVADYVTASVTFASALAPDLSLQIVTPLSWTISDQVQTISSAIGSPYLLSSTFSTDSAGNIFYWEFGAATSSSAYSSLANEIETDQFSCAPVCSTFSQDTGEITYSDGGYNQNLAGTWQVQGATPEPGTGALAVAAIAMAAARRRLTRGRSPVSSYIAGTSPSEPEPSGARTR